MPDLRRESAVRLGAAVGHAGELVQHLLVERRDAKVEREVEGLATAGEVLVQLAPHGVERRPQHAGAEHARELVLSGVDAVAETAESAVGHRDEQLAERRVDQVVAGIDQPCRQGGGAEADVEIGSDSRHGALLALSRRTPDDAAARAASSDEPSAVPISA